MSITLDHLLIPARDRRVSAERIANLLGVPWKAQGDFGPFSQVFLNDHCTLDFDEWGDNVPQGHYCFKVSDQAFDAILERLKYNDIAFRSSPHGPNDCQVSTTFGGRLLYWSEPDGHTWEVLTVSYERLGNEKSEG